MTDLCFNPNIPKPYTDILSVLENAGHKAYFAGGCVRDTVMGISPHDYDIATSAVPSQVIKLFSDSTVIPTGLKHGTVTVIRGGVQVEITTFRTDGKYLDNRHPESVSFSTNVEEDTKRRDFTVNAMCYSEKHGLVDHHGGLEDIKRKLIRCVGNPYQRFEEDALRILRALRFSARLGFDIEKETADAMTALSHLLDNIARERVLSELKAFFLCDCTALVTRFASILSTAIKLKSAVDFSCIANTLSQLDAGYRLAAFFALCSGSVQGATELISGLKADKETTFAVKCAAESIYTNCLSDTEKLALTISGAGVENTKMMLVLASVQNIPLAKGAFDQVELTEKGKLPISVSQLEVNGTILMRQQIAHGKQLGAVLKHLFLSVHRGLPNTKQALLDEAIAFIKYSN